uniref:Protein kinase domain-containing protein n=1 Tax=Aegilops tauschii subsp. strangulata TaxID=200361 RepID=A0A453MI36_AEGTS
RQASTSHIHVLERILLDENAEPTDLPLSLLKGITNGFSPAHQIGRGGFAEVYKVTSAQLVSPVLLSCA